MGNIALLGACVKLLLPGGLDFLDQAIRGRLGAAADANVLAAREGYARCTRQHTLVRGHRARSGRSRERLPARPRLRGQHTRLASQPHRLVVARPPRVERGVQRLRGLRALLPRGRDHPRRPHDHDRLPLLQGVRHLRGRLPRPRRDRDGGGARVNDAAARPHGAHLRRGGRLRRGARAGAGDRFVPDHAADDHRRAPCRSRCGPRGRRVHEPRERALDVRFCRRRLARGRPHVHGDVVAGPPLRARAAPPCLARARAGRRRQHQPRDLRPLESRGRLLRQHEPAGHRVDPAVLRVRAGSSRHRPLRLPDRRDRDAAGARQRRGLPALAYRRDRRCPRTGRRRPLPPRLRPAAGLAARPGRATGVLGAARAEGLCGVPAQRLRRARRSPGDDRAGRVGVHEPVRAREGRRARRFRQLRREHGARHPRDDRRVGARTPRRGRRPVARAHARVPAVPRSRARVGPRQRRPGHGHRPGGSLRRPRPPGRRRPLARPPARSNRGRRRRCRRHRRDAGHAALGARARGEPGATPVHVPEGIA